MNSPATAALTFTCSTAPPTTGTTFKNAPAVKTDYGMAKLEPGHSYSVANIPCPGGSAIGIKAQACGDTYLNYFQDYNPSRKSLLTLLQMRQLLIKKPAIGLYLSIC